MNRNIIQSLSDVIKDVESLRHDIKQQQHTHHNLLQDILKLHTHYRLNKGYEISDQLRAIINRAGYRIVQGTNNIGWDEIKKRKLEGLPAKDCLERVI